MDRLMPFDELNTLRTTVQNIFETDRENKRQYLEFLLDEIEEILILSYIYGNEAANTMLGTGYIAKEDDVSASVNKVIAGKTWRQRVTEYLENEENAELSVQKGDFTEKSDNIPRTRRITAEDIMRVVETDSHRVYNEAIWNVAARAQDNGIVVYKEWVCMMLPTSRDTHIYLNGEKIPLNEEFFSYDGDYALHPGGFLFPENNINCLCRLVLTRA